MSTSLESLLKELNFELDNELGHGASSTVYKVHSPDHKYYALKLEKNSRSINRQDEKKRFRVEAATLARMQNQGLIHVFAQGEIDDLNYLVMEYAAGFSLDKTIQQGALEEKLIIQYSIMLAEALAEAHSFGFIHRDLKPQNIIVTPDHKIKLLDFGFATLASAGDSENKQTEIVGTFLYSSPEQSGMLNRPVDGRADLYSLGVVMYECATGQLPFQSNDVGELMHKHMTETPPSIEKKNSQISPILCQIIYKLLAKDPDERYQSAEGLKSDLLRIETLRADKNVELGLNDNIANLKIDLPLFGREEEVKSLVQEFKKAHAGKGSVVLVQGDPGIGKSRLMRELVVEANKIANQAILVLSCKAVKGDSLPFAPIRQAIDNFIKNVESLSLSERERQITELKNAMGDLAPVLKDFTPRISLIIQNPESLKSQAVSEDIFQGAVVEFLVRVFKRYGTGLFFIDDIQWFDDASTKVIRQLAGLVSKNRTLISCTSRNDIASEKKLNQFIQDLNSLDALALNMTIAPLGEKAIKEMVSTQLRGGEVDQALVQQLVMRTNGNPFAADEYLRAMHSAGLLRPSWGRWLVDIQQLEKISLPSDVIQLVISRLTNLSQLTKKVLSYAAVLGSNFSTNHLSAYCGFSIEDINRAIMEGGQSRLIEHEGANEYQFIHDRIREALVAEFSVDELKQVNQKIAESMDTILFSQNQKTINSESVYKLASLYNNGLTSKNPQRVYEINFMAGKLASASYANEQAYLFLESALMVATQYKIEVDVNFDQLMGEVCTWTFRLKDASDYLASAIKKAKTPLHRAQLLGIIARCQLNGWQNIEAWKYVNAALSEIGHPLPKSKMSFILTSLGYWLLGAICRKLQIYQYIRKNTEQRKTLVFLFNLAGEIAIFMNPKMLPAPAVRALFYADLIEGDETVVRSYATFAMLMQAFKKFQVSEFYHNKAMSLAEKLGDRVSVAEVYYMRGASFSVVGKFDEFEKICKVIHEQYYQWAEPIKLFNALFGAGWVHMMRGETTESIRCSDELTKRSKSAKKSSLVKDHMSPGFNNLNLILRGDIGEAMTDLMNIKKKLDAVLPNSMIGGDCYSTLLHAKFEMRELDESVEEIIACLYKIAPPNFSSFVMKNGYIAILNIRVEQFFNALKAQKNDEIVLRLNQVRQTLADLILASKGAEFYMPFILVGQAVLHYQKGEQSKLWECYSQAESIAIQCSNKNALYEIHRSRAQLWKLLGNMRAAKADAELALNLAAMSNWKIRVKSIKEEFNLENSSHEIVGSGRVEYGDSQSSQRHTSIVGKDSINMKRHLDSLLQVSLAPAGIFDPIQQLQIALDEIVKVMNADRAYVFLVSEETGQLYFAGGRDAKKESLSQPKGYSNTVVQKVASDKKALIVTGTEEGRALGSESAVVHNLRSIMSAPLILRDQLKGVVYLDSQLAKGLFTEDDIMLLNGIASHIAIAFETAKLANLEAEKRSLQKDLEIGSSVQTLFLPKNQLRKTDELSLYGYYRPAAQCGGDWWWHEARTDGKTLVVLGDVTGHGAGPAMITASIASHFLSICKSDDQFDIAKVFQAVSQQLHDFAGGDYLMTALAILVDEKNKSLTTWSAGGPAVTIISKDKEVRFSSQMGTPMGLGEGTEIGVEKIDLKSGDRIVISTDGIPESMTMSGRYLGEKKMIQMIKETMRDDTQNAVKGFIDQVDRLRGHHAQGDDYTIVMVDVI